MSARTAGRLLLTLVLLVTVAAEVAFTWLGWTGQHIFNPMWHPHARFHAVQMSVCIGALSLVALVPLWSARSRKGPVRGRHTVAPEVLAWAIGLLQVCWWGGEFVATAVPGTSPSPDLTRPNTFDLVGVPVYGNLFFAGLIIVLAVLGGVLLARTPPSAAKGTATTEGPAEGSVPAEGPATGAPDANPDRRTAAGRLGSVATPDVVAAITDARDPGLANDP